jgi:hypothetical protein
MAAITGVDGNSVYIPVPFLQENRYTLISGAWADGPQTFLIGRGDDGHTTHFGHFCGQFAT